MDNEKYYEKELADKNLDRVAGGLGEMTHMECELCHRSAHWDGNHEGKRYDCPMCGGKNSLVGLRSS